jgi:hypothetical protein
MNSIKVAFAALVAGVSISVSMPVMAQSGDSGNVMDSKTTNVITGDRNTSTSKTNQRANCVNNGSGTSGDCASVMRSDTLNDTLGNDNINKSETNQEFNSVRNSDRGRVRVRN